MPLEIRPVVRLHGDDIDIEILRTHERTDFGRYVMGGVSAKLVWTSTVPVMWVREPGPEVVPDSCMDCVLATSARAIGVESHTF